MACISASRGPLIPVGCACGRSVWSFREGGSRGRAASSRSRKPLSRIARLATLDRLVYDGQRKDTETVQVRDRLVVFRDQNSGAE